MSNPVASPTNPRTVMLRVNALGEGYDEHRVAATKSVKPGYLIEVAGTDANGAVTVQPHSTAGGQAESRVAVEPGFTAEIPGETTATTGGIDDTIAAGDLCRNRVMRSGDEAYMFLKNGENATLTSFLTSAGDGTLKVASGSDVRLFKPKVALNNTTGAAARVRARRL